MPEGPEILNAANQLQRVLVGNVLQEIYFRMARLKPFEACRVGTTVEAIETRWQGNAHETEQRTHALHAQRIARSLVRRRARPSAPNPAQAHGGVAYTTSLRAALQRYNNQRARRPRRARASIFEQART